MSSTTNIFVTPSTSLILIRNVSTPTNIYLSSFNTPNFTVSVRDTTGSSSIFTSSVYLSTIGTARFADGSFLYTLNQPYGFVNLGFRNSSFWQVLHTSGQVPLDSAANVGKLNLSTSYVGLLSTGAATISSFVVENLTTTNAIVIDGPLVLTNLSAPGIVTVQSTFNVYGDVQMDRQLFVSGNTYVHSSLTAVDVLPISNITRVFSSFGIGGYLSVGGTLTIGSTLFTQSDNFVSSLQIQKSTSLTTTTVEGSLTVGNLLSSLQSFAVQENAQTYSSRNTNSFVIAQTISSIASNAVFSTNVLAVGGPSLLKGPVSTTNATFRSTLDLGSTLSIRGVASVGSLFVGGDFYTKTFTAQSLSSVSSFSTGIASVAFSTFFSSGLSTTGIQVLDFASVSQTFVTIATVSSLGNTNVGKTLYVQENALFDALSFGSSVVTNSLFASTLSLNSLSISSLSTLGSLTARGTVEIGNFLRDIKGARVYEDALVLSNVINSGTATISSIQANSYLVQTLYITTSSPSVALRASSFFASTVAVDSFLVRITDPPQLSVFSTFASTTQLDTGVAEAFRVQTANTSSLLWGLSTFEGIQASLDVLSHFPKGLSAQTILANSITADLFSTIGFIGDAQGMSNISLGSFSNLSVTTAIASTFSTAELFVSSLYTSTFRNSTFTNAFSSFQSPTLAIEGVGFQARGDKNTILLLDSNLYAVNNTLYIDTLQNRVGINISSPQADLDVSGGFYPVGGLYYSTQNSTIVSSLSLSTILSSVITSYVFVRDTMDLSTSVLYLSNTSLDSNNAPFPAFVLSSQQTGPTNTFSLTALQSSISLLNLFYIHNDLKTVSFDETTSSEEFYFSTLTVSSFAYLSTLSVSQSALTNSLTTPYLLMNPTEQTSFYTTISTGSQTLYFNSNLLTLANTLPPKMGIHTTNPGGNVPLATLDISGDAYFSSLSLVGPVIPRNLSLGSALL